MQKIDVFQQFSNDLKSVVRVSIDGHNYLRVDNIQGSVMFLPRHAYNMLWGIIFYGCWEPKETEFVKKFIKPGMITVDIGAFVGYYTLLFARLVGETGLVACFEPLNEAREACMESVKDNRYKNVLFSNRIVSNCIGKVAYDSDTLFAGNAGNELDMIDLDTAILDQECVDFVKTDVEGYDCKVLEGMQKTIAKNCNIVIMMEYCPALWERCGSDPVRFRKLLDEYNLSAFVLLDGNEVESFSKKHMMYDLFPGKSVKELELVDLHVETLILCRDFAQIEDVVKLKDRRESGKCRK